MIGGIQKVVVAGPKYTNICMSSAEREPAENAHKAPEPSSGVLENASREYGQSISFQVSKF